MFVEKYVQNKIIRHLTENGVGKSQCCCVFLQSAKVCSTMKI